MKRFCHVVFLVFFIFYSLIFPVYAYANVATASKLAVAVGKSLLTKMKNQGFAANDPRFVPTLSAASVSLSDVATAAAGAGGSVLLGAVGAPVWLTLAAGFAVGAGLQLAMDYAMPNLPQPVATGSNNPYMNVSAGSGLPTFNYTTTVTNPNPDTAPRGLISTDSLWYFGSPTGYSTVQDYVSWFNSLPMPTYTQIMVNVNVGLTSYSYNATSKQVTASVLYTYDMIDCRTDIYPNDVKPSCTGMVRHQSATAAKLPGTCPSGSSWSTLTFQCLPPPTVTVTQTKTGTPQDLANGTFSINDGIGASPLNPQIVADLANKAWQQAAAKPGYTGVPYSIYDPVSSWDVAQSYSTQNNPNGDIYPTVQDSLSPVGAPGSVISININPDPATSTAGSGSSVVDLGPDPAIVAPVLESTPTASQILSPLLNLMPDLKSFVVPSHAAACPRPSASIWGQTLTLSGHCDLLDDPAIHDSLYAVMALVWTMVGLFIVLRA